MATGKTGTDAYRGGARTAISPSVTLSLVSEVEFRSDLNQPRRCRTDYVSEAATGNVPVHRRRAVELSVVEYIERLKA